VFETSPIPEPLPRRKLPLKDPLLIIFYFLKTVRVLRQLFFAKLSKCVLPFKGILPGFKREHYVTVQEAAQCLYYSKSSIRRLIHTGKLRGFKKDGHFYIMPEDVALHRYRQILSKNHKNTSVRF
jgi:excisionase family DNA binding protein